MQKMTIEKKISQQELVNAGTYAMFAAMKNAQKNNPKLSTDFEIFKEAADSFQKGFGCALVILGFSPETVEEVTREILELAAKN